MLPNYYKFRVYNDAGVSVTVQVDWQPYAWSGGSLAYAANTTPIGSGAISSATAGTSSAIDNSTAKNAGGFLTVGATPGSSPTGNKQLIIYLLGSNDNSIFEDLQGGVGEGTGTVLGEMPLAGTSLLHMQLEV